MKIILYDYKTGSEITIKSGNQKHWELLTQQEQDLIVTLLSHNNAEQYDGKSIKMGTTIATVRIEQ
tara:strand:- start:845 stop:1042 length:198 start_codon:yes stop_codon:yes gene_type:complete